MNEHHTCKWSSYCPECEVDRLRCEGELRLEDNRRYYKALKEIATGLNTDGEKVDFFQDIAQEALALVSEERDRHIAEANEHLDKI